MVPENSVGAEKANATARVELRPAVFLSWLLPARRTGYGPDLARSMLLMRRRNLGLCRVPQKENIRERNLEANTILVRFPSIEFSFE